MGGLEEILNQIKADANEEAADILGKGTRHLRLYKRKRLKWKLIK